MSTSLVNNWFAVVLIAAFVDDKCLLDCVASKDFEPFKKQVGELCWECVLPFFLSFFLFFLSPQPVSLDRTKATETTGLSVG